MNYGMYADAYPVPRHRRPADFEAKQDAALNEFRQRFRDRINCTQESWMAGLMCFGFEEEDENDAPVEFILKCPNLERAEQVMHGTTTIGCFPVRIVSGSFEQFMFAQNPQNQGYCRPIRVGSSIGPRGRDSSGTLGCFFRDINNGTVYAVTCEHVATLGEIIQQPSMSDGIQIQEDVAQEECTYYHDATDILAGDFDIGRVSYIDTDHHALALILIEERHNVLGVDNVLATRAELPLPVRTKLRPLPGTADFRFVNVATEEDLRRGEHLFTTDVVKRGRKTNITVGAVHDIKYEGRFEDEPYPKIWRTVVRSDDFSGRGDSGSAIGFFDRNGDGTILGILYGGDTVHGRSHYGVSLHPFLAELAEKGIHLRLV
jgi:hypothetical protein